MSIDITLALSASDSPVAMQFSLVCLSHLLSSFIVLYVLNIKNRSKSTACDIARESRAPCVGKNVMLHVWPVSSR